MFLQTLVPSLSEEAHTCILQRCVTVACCLMGTLKQFIVLFTKDTDQSLFIHKIVSLLHGRPWNRV